MIESTLKSKQILFIGGGNMATAIISGLINAEIPTSHISVIDHNLDKLNYLQSKYGVHTPQSINDLSNTADIIILAVKPIGIKQACHEINQIINTNTLVISVAAGITIESLSAWLPSTSNIIRAMPNTPAAVRSGMTVLYQKPHIDSNYQQVTESLFSAVGSILWVSNEEEINTTMTISGCGPAYFFLFFESLMAAGKNLGLSEDTCKKLITSTANGSCKLYEQSNKSAETLRKEVTSPNGTTEQAINTLDIEKTKNLFTKALEAALKKAKLIERQLES